MFSFSKKLDGSLKIGKSIDPNIKIMFWNIANLGGGFGYSPEREKYIMETISALAAKIEEVDVLVICEVKAYCPPPIQPVGLNINYIEPSSRNLKFNPEGAKYHNLDDKYDSKKGGTLENYTLEIYDQIPELIEILGIEDKVEEGRIVATDKKDSQTITKIVEDHISQVVNDSFDRVGRNSASEKEFARIKAGIFENLKRLDLNSEDGFEERKKKYFKELDKYEKKRDVKDSGVQEAKRIIAEFPKNYHMFIPENKNLIEYTKDETYCLIYNKGKVKINGYDYLDVYIKRQPCLFYCEFNGVEFDLIAYHAPSSSVNNTDARAVDFAAFLKSCSEVKGVFSKTIVVTGDFNIDTMNANNIGNCSSVISKMDYFNKLTPHRPSEFLGIATTMRMARGNKWKEGLTASAYDAIFSLRDENISDARVVSPQEIYLLARSYAEDYPDVSAVMNIINFRKKNHHEVHFPLNDGKIILKYARQVSDHLPIISRISLKT